MEILCWKGEHFFFPVLQVSIRKESTVKVFWLLMQWSGILHTQEQKRLRTGWLVTQYQFYAEWFFCLVYNPDLIQPITFRGHLLWYLHFSGVVDPFAEGENMFNSLSSYLHIQLGLICIFIFPWHGNQKLAAVCWGWHFVAFFFFSFKFPTCFLSTVYIGSNTANHFGRTWLLVHHDTQCVLLHNSIFLITCLY